MTCRMPMTALACLFLTLAAGCATERPGVRPTDARALTAAELRSVIDRAANEGRVFDDGHDGGLSYAFRADGRLIVTSRFLTRRSVDGRWRIDGAGARLCARFEPDPETCAAVYRLAGAGEGYYVDAEGGTQQANTFVMR